MTPAVLARDAVLALAQYLETRSAGRGWRSYLVRNLPWTEYSLYNTFLEGVGLLDRYHVDGGEDSIYGNAVWMEGQWAEWDAAASFGPAVPFCFSVVQSATRIPPEAVWERVEPHVAAERRSARDPGAARAGK